MVQPPVKRDSAAQRPIVELLSPAGTVECAHAAIENGADAIYFGLDVGFNARARAHNIGLDELPTLMARMHQRGVRGYVTLNTLVFTDELRRLEQHVREVTEAGVDAVLVQDLGAARLIKAVSPEMEIHASTQMTLTCAAAIEGVRPLGIDRVVLARELSLKEIGHITQRTSVPVEVFVHGALCVAYSGQCLTSESLGGRSANRGQCAQACRLPYQLICDGELRDLEEVKYLLSPQDLAAYDLVHPLIQLGVASLKIEGRLKTPEYVANVTQQYRRAVNESLNQRPAPLGPREKRDMEMSFSRGFSPGWLEGCDHKRLVPGLSSAKRGVLVGRVIQGFRDRLLVDLEHPLAAGDGIVLQGDRIRNAEVGGRVFAVIQNKQRLTEPGLGRVELTFAEGTVDPDRTFAGQEIWQTDDPRLNRRLRKSFTGLDPVRRVPIHIEVIATAGEPLQVTARCLDGITVEIRDEQRLATARQHPLTIDELRKQLGRLGGSAYILADCSAKIVGEPMVPHSTLGRIRKEIIAGLDALRTKPVLRLLGAPGIADRMLRDARYAFQQHAFQQPEHAHDSAKQAAIPPCLHILCRTLGQVHAALASGARSLIADFHDLRQYKEAVQAAHKEGASMSLASLRIHKPGEDGLFVALAKSPANSWLVRNLPALRFAQANSIPFVADFSLNITNPLSAQEVMRWGAARITASYDMNRDQLLELVEAIPAQYLEVVIHQHMPLFHMEHCVFCAVMSPGKNKSDCGRPCDRHVVALKDHVGVEHPLHADIGCRNTLYNGVAQSGAEAVTPLLRRGVRHFRIELLQEESRSSVGRLITLYQDLLHERIDGGSVWRALKAMNRVGVTRGTLEQPRDPLAIV